MSIPTLPEIETWLPVVGWEGLYDVSDQGRVRSVDRIVRYSDGRQAKFRAQVLTLKRNGKYRRLYVGLCRNGIHHYSYVHTLVLEAHVGPCPSGLECCHWDDDPTNNHVSNLRWDTRTANRQDALRNGRSFDSQSVKTKCPQGHPYDDENTYRYKSGRQCRKCRRDHDRKWRAKQ
jgi:hypothetical protein